jgi:hypothetical protein
MKRVLTLLLLVACPGPPPIEEAPAETVEAPEPSASAPAPVVSVSAPQPELPAERPLASFTTRFKAGKGMEGRIENITLIAKKFSDYKLDPGAEFSFNAVVGPRTKEAGFKDAPTFFMGELPRNFGVNLTALIRHGTIEYRFFAGTLDPTLVAAYIELCARFTALALDCEPVLRPPRPPNEASMEVLLDLLEVSAATRAVLLTDDVRAHARSVMTPRPLGVPALDLSLLDSESQCLARQALRACG